MGDPVGDAVGDAVDTVGDPVGDAVGEALTHIGRVAEHPISKGASSESQGPRLSQGTQSAAEVPPLLWQTTHEHQT